MEARKGRREKGKARMDEIGVGYAGVRAIGATNAHGILFRSKNKGWGKREVVL